MKIKYVLPVVILMNCLTLIPDGKACFADEAVKDKLQLGQEEIHTLSAIPGGILLIDGAGIYSAQDDGSEIDSEHPNELYDNALGRRLVSIDGENMEEQLSTACKMVRDYVIAKGIGSENTVCSRPESSCVTRDDPDSRFTLLFPWTWGAGTSLTTCSSSIELNLVRISKK